MGYLTLLHYPKMTVHQSGVVQSVLHDIRNFKTAPTPTVCTQDSRLPVRQALIVSTSELTGGPLVGSWEWRKESYSIPMQLLRTK